MKQKGQLMPPSVSAQGDINWRSSRRCDGGQCVLVAGQDGSVLIGNASCQRSLYLTFAVAEWQAFVGRIKSGNLDRIE